MRTLRWIVLTAAVALVAVGCNGKLSDNGDTDTAPPPITSISAPVVGFAGSANTRFEAPGITHAEVLAAGTLVASASRFAATFHPLAEVPPNVLEPGLPEIGFEDRDFVCDVTVVPAALRATGVFMFFQVGSFGMMFLSTFDFFFSGAGGPFPVDARFSSFVLADRAGRIQGTCDDPGSGGTIDYAVDLVEGWNAVAFVVTSVDDDGNPESWRIQDELPTPQAKWFYVGIDSDIADEARAGTFIAW